MNVFYLELSEITTSNETSNTTNLWLTVVSIIIAVLAIIISTFCAWKSYYQDKVTNIQNKKEALFDIFNNFLLFLETITNAERYGISDFKPENFEIDLQCLQAIGKIHCFCQKNNLINDSCKKLQENIESLRLISNDIQDGRIIVDNDERKTALKKIDGQIKNLRKIILEEIKVPSFFEENELIKKI